jgi:hypothetical protein
MSSPRAMPDRAGSGWRASYAWRGLLLAGLAVAGLLYASARTTTMSGLKTAVATDCDAWDRAASEGIAAIISDRSIAAELRLDEAILQLRRARKNCRAGAVALAGHDYASLQRTFPGSTGSSRATVRAEADETPIISPPPR